MNYKKPAAVILAGVFAVNAFDSRYGIQVFTDLPPMSAVAVTSASSSTMNVPFYSTTTDELIEAPVPEQIRVTRSS
jgi:hypothetical protein